MGALRFADGSEAPYDLLVAVPVHRAPQPVRACPLAGETGMIPVDPAGLGTRFPGVWALGDGIAFRLPGRYRPDTPLALPKAGVFAHRQATVVAENVAAYLAGGRGPARSFDGVGFCLVGVGEGKAGFEVGRFFTEPQPQVRLLVPARMWQWGKGFFERAWLDWVEGRRRGDVLLHLVGSWAERYLAGV